MIFKYICVLQIIIITLLLQCAVNGDENVKVLSDDPIVIQTAERNYDEPSVRDYEECNHSRKKCQRMCEMEASSANADCVSKCPVCPVLINHNMVIQGYNDTDTKMLKHSTVNTTNIIRLTNEIRNVINNNMGNITTRSENNIHVYENNATATVSNNDKSNPGQNGTESCCLVIHREHCTRRKQKAMNCEPIKKRECGEICKARIMISKRVLLCNAKDECHHEVRYVPYQRSRRSSQCNYVPYWPFMHCPQDNRLVCQRCMQLPYLYVLMNGLPPFCMNCWGGSPFMQSPYPNNYLQPMYPKQQFGNNEWHLTKSKCRDEDGNIIDDCDPLTSNKRENDLDFWNEDVNPEGSAEYPDNDYENDVNEFLAYKRRPYAFNPSKYSRRRI